MTFIYFSPALCVILVYDCGLTVHNKRICCVMIYCNMGNIRVILWYIAKITTNFYRIGSDSPHRRRVTPLLRAIGFLRQAQRLDASGTRPPKVPLLLGAALHLMHGSLGQREPASLSAPESAHWRTQHANRQTNTPRYVTTYAATARIHALLCMHATYAKSDQLHV